MLPRSIGKRFRHNKDRHVHQTNYKYTNISYFCTVPNYDQIALSYTAERRSKCGQLARSSPLYWPFQRPANILSLGVDGTTQKGQLLTRMGPESLSIKNLADFGGSANTKQKISQRAEACLFTVLTIWVHGPGKDWLWVCLSLRIFTISIVVVES
jgi:hypothetical protein